MLFVVFVGCVFHTWYVGLTLRRTYVESRTTNKQEQTHEEQQPSKQPLPTQPSHNTQAQAFLPPRAYYTYTQPQSPDRRALYVKYTKCKTVIQWRWA